MNSDSFPFNSRFIHLSSKLDGYDSKVQNSEKSGYITHYDYKRDNVSLCLDIKILIGDLIIMFYQIEDVILYFYFLKKLYYNGFENCQVIFCSCSLI